MKISLCQTIAIVCILSVGFMIAAPFLQRAEAKPTKIIFATYFYQCVTFADGVCIKPTSWMNDVEEESWFHKNWRHKDNHPVIFDEITYSRTEIVDGCSQCSGTID